MRAAKPIVLYLIAALLLVSCDKNQNSDTSRQSNLQTTSGDTVSTPAAPPPASTPLCDLINRGQANLAQVPTGANETNPLRQAEAQGNYNASAQNLASQVQAFLSNNSTFTNYVGTVQGMNYQNYSDGSGVNLVIKLPCNATAYGQFLDPRPGWPVPNPDRTASLSAFRQVLESLHNGDTVTFSGRIVWQPGWNQYNGGLSLYIVFTAVRSGQ